MNAVMHPTIALLQSSSLTNVVQQEIERAILVGEYAPGSKLIEATLADKMGVSRGPVREAFRMLEEAGLVRTEKNRGVFVRDIPIDEAVEIFDLRAAMDELVGRQLAQNITPAQLKEIKGLVDQMEKAVKASPSQPVFQNQLGLSLRHAGKFAKAREAYESAVALDPGYADAHLNLGVLLDLYLGEPTLALVHYERYIALVPGGDAGVGKWVADLKTRKTASVAQADPKNTKKVP